jgi:Flp pilus assembly protein TadD
LITIFAPLFEWVPDTDHPDTVRPWNSLAMSYLAAGQPAKAIPLYKQTLADCERVLGADHPDTLRSRNNLAMSYRAAGRTAKAIPLLERTIADCERILGADHPDTKAARENLAAMTGGIPQPPRL